LTKARTVLAVLVALFALLTLFDRFVLLELLARRIGLPLLLAAATALASIACGRAARASRPADPVVEFLIGYPLFGTICFLAGTLKIETWTMMPLVAIGAIAGAWTLRRVPPASGLPPVSPLPFVAIALVLLCAFVAAQAPPATLDELAYHLAVPQAWVLEGRAIEFPLLSHSYFPLGIESADLPLLTVLGQVEGGIASHLLHLFAAIATTVLIARRTQSWLAAAAIVTTPALAVTAGWSLVDWPLLGLFVVLYGALEDDDLETASAATAAGLLTKYTFIPFAILGWALKKRIPKPIALVGLLFFVRNLIVAGNPIAPFFSGDAPHVAGYRALALADYVFEGNFIDEALGASLLALAVFATGRIALASLALGIALFFLAPSARILVPFFAIAAISAAPELRRRVLAALIGMAVVVQMFMVVWLTARSGAFAMLAGNVAEDQYLLRQRPSYAATAWLNTTLPPGSRTLVIGANETYWFARPVRGGGNFDGPRLSRYLDLPTPEAVRERLRRDGITHIAVITAPPPTQVAQKREERLTTLTPPAQRMLAIMIDRYAGTVTSRGTTTLFTLR
jgi:hypothetical protein